MNVLLGFLRAIVEFVIGLFSARTLLPDVPASPAPLPSPEVQPVVIASGAFAPPAGGRSVSPAVWSALIDGARAIGLAPLDALQVLYEESGFHAGVSNGAGAPYYGVNQMGESELASLGLTVDTWLSLPLEKQLPWVFEFWEQKQSATKGEALKDAAHLLAANFLPARVKVTSDEDYALTTKGEAYYDQNSALDANGDGKITIDDLAAWLAKTEARGGADWTELVAGLTAAGGGPSAFGTIAGAAVAAVAVGGALWYAWQRWA